MTYLSTGEPGEEPQVRSGMIVGPLVSDVFDAAIWVAVVPDGGTKRVLIRRDSITGIAPGPRTASRLRP